MAISGDDAIKLYATAVKGLPIDLSGLPLTEENLDFFEKVRQECESAPEGSMAFIPNEWNGLPKK